jgi:hypothetical protein
MLLQAMQDIQAAIQAAVDKQSKKQQAVAAQVKSFPPFAAAGAFTTA